MASHLKRAAALNSMNDGDPGDRRWQNIRMLLEPGEVSLLNALISTRSLNPDLSFYDLHFACAEGDVYKVKRLIDVAGAGCDVNQRFLDLPTGSTPLHWAATSKSNAVIACLLQRGADCNLRYASFRLRVILFFVFFLKLGATTCSPTSKFLYPRHLHVHKHSRDTTHTMKTSLFIHMVTLCFRSIPPDVHSSNLNMSKGTHIAARTHAH